MSAKKKTVPIDDELLGRINIADHNSGADLADRYDRMIVVIANYRWLIGKMAASKQFTDEQQLALKQLIASLDAYQRQP